MHPLEVSALSPGILLGLGGLILSSLSVTAPSGVVLPCDPTGILSFAVTGHCHVTCSISRTVEIWHHRNSKVFIHCGLNTFLNTAAAMKKAEPPGWMIKDTQQGHFCHPANSVSTVRHVKGAILGYAAAR